MKIHSFLLKIEKIGKLFKDSNKICESTYLKGNVASLLKKMRFLLTLKPKE